MALLSNEKRQQYFDFLGLGNVNKTNIKKFQKTALGGKNADGEYGQQTDIALRHWRNVKKYAPNFKPEEFRCTCGHCNGYPTFMRRNELVLIQSIRDHWNRPITVTCGLRCKWYNSRLAGSIANSKHCQGLAIDFYQKGVTDTLANRKKALQWIKKQPNFTYGYGDGINSYGYRVNAPYMGNAMHVDTKATVTKAEPKTPQEKAVAWAKAIAKDESWHYVRFSEGPKAHECPICHDHPKGKYHGWNCIGFAYASWHHGSGLKSKCSNHVVDNATAERILTASAAEALATARKHIGLTDIKVIRNGGNTIPQKKLKAGDICMYYKGNKYIHTFLYAGDGKMVDCTSAGSDANNIKTRTALAPKVAIRYVGK